MRTNSCGTGKRLKSDILRHLLLCEAGFVAFLGVYGGEIELINGMIMPNTVTAFGLRATNHPIAAFFGLGKGIQASGKALIEIIMEDDLDAGSGFATATMNHLRA